MDASRRMTEKGTTLSVTPTQDVFGLQAFSSFGHLKISGEAWSDGDVERSLRLPAFLEDHSVPIWKDRPDHLAKNGSRLNALSSKR
jgi:hypothetical protein